MAMKKKAPEAEKENGERWLVSYADFVTLLLGVFIIMYSMAAADAKAAGSDGANQTSAIAALAGAFGNITLSEIAGGDSVIPMYEGDSLAVMEQAAMEAIAEEIQQMSSEMLGIADDSIEVLIDELGVHIRIKDTVLFSSGSAEITNDNAKLLLTKIGNSLKNFPTNYIQIEGHTDNVPMSGTIKHLETNWELGSLRAVTVLRTLVRECALTPEYLSAVSFGEFRPIAPNTTADGKNKNRRVEITILRNHEVISTTKK